jgi:hypothetical protein
MEGTPPKRNVPAVIYIFDKLSTKYFSPGEREMIVHFETRVSFISRILKKHRWYWTKIYQFCNSKGCACNMTVYTGGV